MRPIKVGLLVGEFFDGALKRHSGFGGYGMLARHYIAEHLPNSDIHIETIIGFNDETESESTVLDSRKIVTTLPKCPGPLKSPRLPKILLQRLRYNRRLRHYLNSFDLFLSIETVHYGEFLLRYAPRKKLILYIQDPRPQSEWDDLDSLGLADDGTPRPDPLTRRFYRKLVQQDRLVAISQGEDLVRKAKDLYQLPEGLPVQLVRNPVVFDTAFRLGQEPKENAVVFLGRLDPVKRPWLALEVAKRMPHVEFCFLGKTQEGVTPHIIYPYRELPNVKLLGHQAGSVKTELLKRCKFLINTSIHEAIPVSFLEALAYGTLLVSCQNPDSLTERFGAFTGKILGDGREQAGLFVEAIQGLLDNETKRAKLAEQGMAYVKENHDLQAWIQTMRQVICTTATSG
jgi:glycosyltransferase involved in cell wall biosynthesis